MPSENRATQFVEGRDLAERVSEVPRLYEQGNKSTACLLLDCGYLEHCHALTVEEVEGALVRDPRLTDLWLARASDQRITGGWGLDREDGEYRVQNYADGKCLRLRNRPRACAEFVVRYVSFMGDVLARWR